MVTVTKIEFGEQRHVPDDQPQRRVGDVQAGQAQLHDVPQFTPVVDLTWKAEAAAEPRAVLQTSANLYEMHCDTQHCCPELTSDVFACLLLWRGHQQERLPILDTGTWTITTS